MTENKQLTPYSLSTKQQEQLTPKPFDRPMFADWEDPVFDGPRKKQSVPNNLRLNTENDGE